ncbi:DUF3108 domain-containing protein [Limnohabitans sp. 63ED37-2]|uniref:DUF3108 domain-containing protein n=1 Tax=Limnohabitans sp. 63ED37-2 TaxID=1678128 RepID=UPI0007068CF4|nr:DUF3108 domain-containing protein [Limnohabitans sp. 63ED37-2]ALK89952.1 hypothetical protein L63ED372_02753 [Limnohabitans sp. 63ED37-2]
MSTVAPTHSKPPPAAPLTGRPSTRSLLRWGALVGVLHLFFLMSLAGTLDLQLSGPQTLRTGPMQTRTLANSAHGPTVSELNLTPARTRVALVKKPRPAPIPKPTAPPTAAAPNVPHPQAAPSDTALPDAGSPTPQQALDRDPALPATLATATHEPAQELEPQTHTAPSAEPTPAANALTQVPGTVIAKADGTETGQSPDKSVSTSEGTAQFATPSPERIASATMALPAVALGSLPPSALLSYKLSGQEKGIQYQASGELRWQHNASAYAMSLSVKAFLLGSRHWRSAGQINATGLAPTRFSDSWRSERAAHFDRPNQRIVFSNNAPTTPLQPGAQDQVSLYAQLAAAMTQSGKRMQPGTRLQIQTATVRDALPWLLTLEKVETLQMDGKSVETIKWVCQPRNRFDAQVEFWVSAAHDWLPTRIRITQVSGSFIDLQLTGREALADLPPAQ